MSDEESPARREGGPEAGEGEAPPEAAPDPVLAERERCLAAVREVLLQGPIPLSLTHACARIEEAIRGELEG